VVAVTLRVSTTSDSGAMSDASGEIWQVTAFDRPSLFTMVPSNMGASPVAANLGPVVLSMTYSWSLPINLVAANAPVYLAIEPVSADSIRYWNTKGAVPPELVIDLQ